MYFIHIYTLYFSQQRKQILQKKYERKIDTINMKLLNVT